MSQIRTIAHPTDLSRASRPAFRHAVEMEDVAVAQAGAQPCPVLTVRGK